MYEQVLNATVSAFLGIPFAQPPTGDNRFRTPSPVQPWPGVLDATSVSSPCMQFSSRSFDWVPKDETPSEDCLYLNVWVPGECCSPDQKLPVLVWIHGGGFYSGSSSMPVYEGSVLAAYGNVTVVTFNYRVGAFGFLSAGNDEAPGNAGLMDQNLVLTWVRNNIRFFGGDENSITLVGESAGAVSISLHMVSPLSRGLFNRAVLQSATAYQPEMVDSSAVAFVKANAYAQLVGCAYSNTSIESDPRVLECLKNYDAMELAREEDIFTRTFPQYFLPSYVNEFLPVNPHQAIHDGQMAPVGVLAGNDRDECSIFLNYIMPDVFDLHSTPLMNLSAARQIIAALFQTVPDPPSSVIFDHYFQNLTDHDSPEIVQAIVDAFSDYVFDCPVKYFAEKANTSHVYWFSHRSSKEVTADWLGVPHFSEVPFVFGRPIRDSAKYSEEDGRFSRDLVRMWTHFAATGEPLENENSSSDWPIFTREHPTAYELNPSRSGQLVYPRTDACEFWRPYFEPTS